MDTRKQKGHLLIETLVTILLLAVGATGLISIQLKALRLNYDAQLVSDVSVLNRAILQQLRARPDIFDQRSFNIEMSSIPGSTQPSNDFPMISDIMSRFGKLGADFLVEIECEADDLKICEICIQNNEPSSTNVLPTGDFDSMSRCNRQIIM